MKSLNEPKYEKSHICPLLLTGVPFGDMKFNDEMEQSSWMMPHMWRANLSGWRPHMRINKNADYSAWVEV